MVICWSFSPSAALLFLVWCRPLLDALPESFVPVVTCRHRRLRPAVSPRFGLQSGPAHVLSALSNGLYSEVLSRRCSSALTAALGKRSISAWASSANSIVLTPAAWREGTSFSADSHRSLCLLSTRHILLTADTPEPTCDGFTTCSDGCNWTRFQGIPQFPGSTERLPINGSA